MRNDRIRLHKENYFWIRFSHFRIYGLFLSLLMLLLLISACVPVALLAGAAGGATVGGAVIYDKRTTQGILNDNTIGKKINYKIAHDPMLQANCRIKVAVFNRVVLLAGQVPSGFMSARAYQLAMSVDDVKRVYNQLEVASNLSLVQQSDDALITSKVKSMMLAKQNLHSTQIKVVTENGVVYLMGIVTRRQAALAASTASHITGVNKVVEVFEYEE